MEAAVHMLIVMRSPLETPPAGRKHRIWRRWRMQFLHWRERRAASGVDLADLLSARSQACRLDKVSRAQPRPTNTSPEARLTLRMRAGPVNRLPSRAASST